MSSELKAEGVMPTITLFQDFVPLSVLWEGPSAPFPSEHAARFTCGKLRKQLTDSQAMATHLGRLIIHPQRFISVIERVGVERASRARWLA
jgi:hypothetical protein